MIDRGGVGRAKLKSEVGESVESVVACTSMIKALSVVQYVMRHIFMKVQLHPYFLFLVSTRI
jgi:hypothetical protein